MDDFGQVVREAAERGDVLQRVREVYDAVAGEVSARQPRCDVSGRCCRFEAYGHRLYVTTMELAAFVAQLPAQGPSSTWDGTGCPYQQDRLCGVHEIRPFGCRMFYCDPSADQWQNELYERLHGQLKRAHEQLNIPYYYVEWRAALAALGLAKANLSLTSQPPRGYIQLRSGLQRSSAGTQHRNPTP